MPAPTDADRTRSLDRELETILTSFDTSYAWNYGSVKEGLRDLYEKAKRDQWNGTTQLAWQTNVDPEGEIVPAGINPLSAYGPFQKLNEKEKAHLRHAQISLQLSQFLHGEQGAMIVASQLVGAVPWMDGKYYASTQTMDEARHVEVFARYLREKLEWEWPINESLKSCSTRSDGLALGPVPRHADSVEGLAGSVRQHVSDGQAPGEGLIHYVMRDESRHVTFGVLAA